MIGLSQAFPPGTWERARPRYVAEAWWDVGVRKLPSLYRPENKEAFIRSEICGSNGTPYRCSVYGVGRT